MRRSFAFLGLLAAIACSGSGDDGDKVSGRDAGVRDIGPRVETITNLDAELQVVAGLSTESLIGDNAVLRQRADGAYMIAYGVVPTGSVKQEIHVATSGTMWTTELAAVPAADVDMASGTLVGLGFDIVNGVPHVAFLGGDDDDNVLTPFPTDLALATKNGGTWSTRVVVDTSGESNGMCETAQNVCNFGNVVGSHASLRANGNDYTIVYRDTHGGFADDDLAFSDVEVYGGSAGASMVDGERSGGGFADVAHLPDGRVVVSYNLYRPLPGDDRVGVWAAVEQSDGTYLERRVDSSETGSKTSIAVATDGTIYVAYYQIEAGDLVLATSTDDGDTWSNEIIDAAGRTGVHPSIALDGADVPAIAYTYCGPTSERDCPGSLGNDSEVRLARREAGAWKLYSVADGQGRGFVGFFNSLVIDSDGKAAIAYQDTRNNDLLFAKER